MEEKVMKKVIKLYDLIESYREWYNWYGIHEECLCLYDILKDIQERAGALPCIKCTFDNIVFRFTLNKEGEISPDFNVNIEALTDCACGRTDCNKDKPPFIFIYSLDDLYRELVEAASDKLDYYVDAYEGELIAELNETYIQVTREKGVDKDEVYEWAKSIKKYSKIF